MLRRLLLWIGLGVSAGLVLSLLAPLPRLDCRSRPRPAASYEEALRRIGELRAAEDPRVADTGHSILLSHGRRAPHVVLFIHGFTNSPEQFRALGERLYARGANVYIPRLPHHGLADRMTADLRFLTAEELVRFSGDQLDIARGLGDSVTVVGFSLGGVQAAWIAQTRADVERVVVISPVFGLALVPQAVTLPLVNFWLRTPNQFPWWDPRVREALPGPRHAYVRYSTRALAETLREARAVAAAARRFPPAAGSITLVTLAGDLAVDNGATAQVAQDWRRQAGGRITSYEFPRTLGLGHDIIDPGQPYQHVAVVYPVLEKLIGWP